MRAKTLCWSGDACHFVDGDSGAPVYKKNKGYGLLVGDVDSFAHCYAMYQGIRAAENALNVDILQMW